MCPCFPAVNFTRHPTERSLRRRLMADESELAEKLSLHSTLGPEFSGRGDRSLMSRRINALSAQTYIVTRARSVSWTIMRSRQGTEHAALSPGPRLTPGGGHVHHGRGFGRPRSEDRSFFEIEPATRGLRAGATAGVP